MDLHKLALLSQADGGPVTRNDIGGCSVPPLDPSDLTSPPLRTGKRSSSTETAAHDQR